MTNVSQTVEYFKKQSKNLLRDYKANSKAAEERIKAVLSDHSEVTLMRAQHVIAVEHGFEKWADVLEARPIQLQLAITMQKYPTLNSFGFGAYNSRAKTAKERADFILSNQLELRGNHHRVEAIFDWLKANHIAPSKVIWKGHSSYGLKKFIERDYGYVTNGEFIAASIIAGFDFFLKDGPNAYFAWTEKSWEMAYHRQRNPKAFRSGDPKAFIHYVWARRITDTPAGDLTVDIKRDRNFPHIESWPQLKRYLEHVSEVPTEVVKAGRQVWQGYQAWLKKSAITR
jgi:myosin-crossreactive antigen